MRTATDTVLDALLDRISASGYVAQIAQLPCGCRLVGSKKQLRKGRPERPWHFAALDPCDSHREHHDTMTLFRQAFPQPAASTHKETP